MLEVSVIIPTYNCAAFLREAIESVLRQTYTNTEVIIVDDGSTDQTKKIVSLFGDTVSFTVEHHRGSSAARNKGIALSRGKYLLFLDADDILEDQCIEKHYERLNNNRSFGMSYAAASFIDHTGSSIGGIFKSKEYGKDELFVKMLERNRILSTSAVMVRRDVLNETGCFNESISYNEEYELWLKITRRWPVSYIDEPLMKYRRHQGNISRNGEKQKANEIMIIQELGYQVIKKKMTATYKRDAERFIALAKIFFRLGDYTESFRYLQKCRKKSIDTDDLHFMLGSYHYVMKDYVNACKEYQKSIEINENNAASHNNIGVLKAKAGCPDTALDYFLRARSIKEFYYDAGHNICCLKNNNNTAQMKVTLLPLRAELIPYTSKIPVCIKYKKYAIVNKMQG